MTATLTGSGCDSCISLRRRRCTSSLMGSRRQSGSAQQQQHANRQTNSPQLQLCSAGERLHLSVYLLRVVGRRRPLEGDRRRGGRKEHTHTHCSRRGSAADDRWAIPPEDIEPLTAATEGEETEEVDEEEEGCSNLAGTAGGSTSRSSSCFLSF